MRHILLPSAIATGTQGMDDAAAVARLVALSGCALPLTPGRAGTALGAIDLAAIAATADQNLSLATGTQKETSRFRSVPCLSSQSDKFLQRLSLPSQHADWLRGATVRRTTSPYPSADPGSLQPRSDQGCRCARAHQGQALRVAAKTRPALTGPARSGCEIWRSGWKNARGAGRTKEWTLPEQSLPRPIYRCRHLRYRS
jgi:hypothetical protein